MMDDETKTQHPEQNAIDKPIENHVEIHSTKNEPTTERYWTRDKLFAVVTFCIANFSVGAYYSILGPFYPQEAAKKGMSSFMTGLVFSCFELIIIISSPFFGTYLTRIGAKFLFVSGLSVAGCTSILFGLLEYCPPGVPFMVMCFCVRTVEGFATSGFLCASMAIIANTFPDKMASMIGNLELFTGLGLMLGPPLGGVLYSLGGFKLPFIFTGSVNIFIAILSIFLLPSQGGMKQQKRHSIFSLLKIPVVVIMGITVAAGTSAIGFIDVGLAIRLSDIYNFTPLIVGVIFLVGPGMYAVMSPIWGVTADKLPQYSIIVICIGYTMSGIGFTMLGPAPFIPIANDQLWLLIISLVAFGMGVGTLVASFQVVSAAAIESGMPESLDTFGLVSGSFNIFFSSGAFVGPLLGGYLLDKLDFSWASFAFACLSFFCTFLCGGYLLVKRPCLQKPPVRDNDKKSSSEETTHLLGDSIAESANAQQNNYNSRNYGSVEDDNSNSIGNEHA